MNVKAAQPSLSPRRAGVGYLEFEFGMADIMAAQSAVELCDQQQLFQFAPRCVGMARAESEVGGDAGRIARVAAHIQKDVRRPAELHLAGDFHELQQLSLPKAGRLVCGPFELPVANRRRVRKGTGEIDSGAEAKRLKTVELPLVVGEQMKFSYDVVHDEPFRRFVRGDQGHNQLTIVQKQ